MAEFVVDTFTDTDATALTAHTPDTGGTWVAHGSSIGTPTAPIVSNRLDASNWGLYGAYYNNATPSSADYIVGVDVQTDGTVDITSGGGVFARLSSSATLTGYLVRMQDAQFLFQKFVSGSATTLGTKSYTPVSNQDYRLYLSCQGTTISVKCQRLDNLNWINSSGVEQAGETTIFSVTDASIGSAGFAGIAGRLAIYGFDNYAAGDTGDIAVEYSESVTSTLSLVGGVNEIEEVVEDTLLLNSAITFFNVIQDRQTPTSVLALTSEVTLSGLIQGEQHVLALTSEATNFLLDTQTPSSTLALTQEATVVFGVPHAAPWGVGGVSQTLSLTGGITNVADRVATTTMSLTQEAIASYGLDSVLAFTQTVSAGIGEDIEQDLGISQVVGRGGSEWLRSITSNAGFTSAGNGWNGNDACFRRFGSSGGPSSAGKLTLFSKDGLYSIILRNPEIDNTRRVAFDRVLRETRGGNLTVYRDQSWNVVQTLLFTIVALKRSTLDDLQTFFLNTLGQEINLVDWLGEEWSGVVTKPDETATEDRNGWWTIAFEFEGSKLDSSGSFQNLNLTSVASATVVP